MSIIKGKRATRVQIDEWVDKVKGRYRCLSRFFEKDDRPALSKIASMILGLDYTPPAFTYANIDEAFVRGISSDELLEKVGAIKVATKHLSIEMLSDLEAHIVKIEISEYGTVEVLEMRDAEGNLVEGEIYVAENGNISYTEHIPTTLDETVDRGDKWGSW